MRDISGPNITRGDIDVTDHDDAAGTPWRVFLPGIPDAGDLTFTLGLDDQDTDHIGAVGTGLLGDFENPGCTLAAFQLTLNSCSGTAIWTFDGYANSMSPSYALEGENVADFGVKVSGKPTLSIT